MPHDRANGDASGPLFESVAVACWDFASPARMLPPSMGVIPLLIVGTVASALAIAAILPRSDCHDRFHVVNRAGCHRAGNEQDSRKAEDRAWLRG